MASSADYDLFVIGAGSGGVRAARTAAARGLRVAVAEKGPLGGTCVNVGCVPKKLLYYASHVAEERQDARGFGWSLGADTFDWPTFVANKNQEISRLNEVYRQLLLESGVEILTGHARLVAADRIRIGDRELTCGTVVIATGGRPRWPEIPGAELMISSDEAFFLDRLPKRIAIVGGGYIATEFASIFHGFGVQVSLLYRGPLFLRGFDRELREGLARAMEQRGIDLRFETEVRAVESTDDGLLLRLGDGSRLESDVAMAAIGRYPNTAELGLESVGLALDDDQAICIDRYYRTAVDNIFAIGDCSAHSGRLNLTPVAIAEAMAVIETAFGERPTAVDTEALPTAVFSQPTIGTVGLSDEEAEAAGYSIDVYRSRFRGLKTTLSGREEQTRVKLVVDRRSGRVLGLHMLGPEAAEIVQGFAVALKCGATKAEFDATIGIHPTTAEEFVTLREPLA